MGGGLHNEARRRGPSVNELTGSYHPLGFLADIYKTRPLAILQ